MPHEEDLWIEKQRKIAEEYLRSHQVEHLGVGEFPAFHVHPYVALWAVQSKKAPGNVGWWAITGDLPADYIGSRGSHHPREALREFSRLWTEVSGFMLRGEVHPCYQIGTPGQWPELGELLLRRAEVIRGYADSDELW